MSNLLCISNQMKQLTLGMQSDCHTFFHMLLDAIDESEINILNSSLTMFPNSNIFSITWNPIGIRMDQVERGFALKIERGALPIPRVV